MNIIFFTHPAFSDSLSISKYTNMLALGMQQKHHTTEIWTASEFFFKIPIKGFFKRWLGYIDQFLIFPIVVKQRLRRYPKSTLFVFADHALGPWIPLVKSRPHIIHCHDFLAQRSALGEFPQNRPGITGKTYQKLINRGYRKGRNFISVSGKTQHDLHKFLEFSPHLSEVVYNGLNDNFSPADPKKAREKVQDIFNFSLKDGYILHVGGNQFYKNRPGVIKIYLEWRKISKMGHPLILVGSPPTEEMKGLIHDTDFSKDIHFLKNVSNEVLKVLYQGAQVFLFPSLEEGFGWPIAEAMASGCPVITTGKPPMTEVGGGSCHYISPYFINGRDDGLWSRESAEILQKVLELGDEKRKSLILAGIANVQRFDAEETITKIEAIYKQVLREHLS